jgi:hypothetical protein
LDRSQANERVWLTWWSEPELPLVRLVEVTVRPLTLPISIAR